MKKLVPILVFVCACKITYAQVKLPLFFSDSMVLQRNSSASIWGTDIANRKIIVTGSWGAKDSTTSNSQGNWKLNINTPNAGGPFTLSINGSNTVLIKDVYVGEVWLCSGQSNMEMPMKGYTNSTPPQVIDSANFFIANSSNPNLRVYMSGWNGTSRIPVTNLTIGKWETASPFTTPDFSAMAYFFARKLQSTLGIPVGIIVTARGGSNIESWMDSTSLASIKPVVIPSTVNWQDAHITHTILYNTMLHPFIGYHIKGIIWAQGESNIGTGNYQELFTKLITSWRDQWGIGEFPFYFAQIAPTGNNTDFNAARLREAQLHTMLSTPNTGMAGTLDIGEQNLTHYPKKKVAGDRLANWALIKNYGFSGIPSGPVFKSLTIKNDTINLRFDYTGNGLTSLGLGLSDFEIAGANKVFYPATVTPANFNYSLNVRSSSVASPLYVRYGFKNWLQGSLFNTNGLPAPSFRTEQMQALYTLLPTVFANINVIQKNEINIISWKSLEEINVNNYEVEQSVDGLIFFSIATKKANGSNSIYTIEHPSSKQNKIIYYRIKVVNKDGSLDYSKTVQLKNNLAVNNFKLLQGLHQEISMYFNSPFTGTITVNDLKGSVISKNSIENRQGFFSLYLPKIIKGINILTFTDAYKNKHTHSVLVL
ncbi:MAG: sialate O-acetylesterase [Chitinophagaceae bacterium]